MTRRTALQSLAAYAAISGSQVAPAAHATEPTSPAAEPTVAPPPGVTSTFARREFTKRTTISQTDTLVVKLPASPGTGYRWEVARVTGAKLAEDGKSKYEEMPGADPDTIGGPVFQVFRFKAGAVGSGAIEFEYRQPFDREARAARTARLDVVVKGGKP